MPPKPKSKKRPAPSTIATLALHAVPEESKKAPQKKKQKPEAAALSPSAAPVPVPSPFDSGRKKSKIPLPPDVFADNIPGVDSGAFKTIDGLLGYLKGSNIQKKHAPPPEGPLILGSFVPKGGSGKTAAVHEMSRLLESMGFRVMVIDADPQANCTSQLLRSFALGGPKYSKVVYDTGGKKYQSDIPQTWNQGKVEHRISNLLERASQAGLAKKDPHLVGIDMVLYHLIEPRPDDEPHVPERFLDDETKARFCYPLDMSISPQGENAGRLLLIPGSMDMHVVEPEINFNPRDVASFNVTRRVPRIFQAIAKQNNIDIIIIDTNPGMTRLNQLLLMNCHRLIIPFFPEPGSVQTIRTCLSILTKWRKELEPLKDRKGNPYFNVKFQPKILGFLPQNVSMRKRAGVNSLRKSVFKDDQQYMEAVLAEIQNLCFPGGKKNPEYTRLLIKTKTPEKKRTSAGQEEYYMGDSAFPGIIDFKLAGKVLRKKGLTSVEAFARDFKMIKKDHQSTVMMLMAGYLWALHLYFDRLPENFRNWMEKNKFHMLSLANKDIAVEDLSSVDCFEEDPHSSAKKSSHAGVALHAFGLAIENTPGEGDCQFIALARGMAILGRHDTHLDIRRDTVEWMRHHMHHFPLLDTLLAADDSPYTNTEDYLEAMAEAGEWGDQATLIAAARRFNLNILVINPPFLAAGDMRAVHHADDALNAQAVDPTTTLIVYYNGGTHYQSVGGDPRAFITAYNQHRAAQAALGAAAAAPPAAAGRAPALQLEATGPKPPPALFSGRLLPQAPRQNPASSPPAPAQASGPGGGSAFVFGPEKSILIPRKPKPTIEGAPTREKR